MLLHKYQIMFLPKEGKYLLLTSVSHPQIDLQPFQ